MIDYKDYESFTSKKEEWKRFKTDGIESNYEISSYGVMFEILLLGNNCEFILIIREVDIQE